MRKRTTFVNKVYFAVNLAKMCKLCQYVGENKGMEMERDRGERETQQKERDGRKIYSKGGGREITIFIQHLTSRMSVYSFQFANSLNVHTNLMLMQFVQP